LLAKGREWRDDVNLRRKFFRIVPEKTSAEDRVFSTNDQRDALNILGLFVLNRFRDFSYEEVRTMLNFDLMDTLAGRQVYDMGHDKGVQEGHDKGLIEEAREMVIEALVERFDFLPNEMANQISAIGQRAMLKTLHRQAVRCQDMANFKETLSKAVNLV
jgi:predicted transposase YdaD